jgi:sialic acid synthase SpsE
VDAYKIASGDNNFVPLLELVAATGKPVIISTGLSDLEQVERAAGFFDGRELAILHCTSAYPAPPEEANLAVIPLLAERLGCTVGYSDHTLGIETCVAAVAAGARVLEKHFTLDKQQSDFRDHRLSADPAELAELVAQVRGAEENGRGPEAVPPVLLGRPTKKPQPSEAELAVAARRAIVAAADLPAGQEIAIEHLTWLRPGDGLPPGEESQLVGRRLKHPVAMGDTIRPEDAG